MPFLGSIIGGIIGGAIGAAIWAGIAYGTGYEIGWIAIGIGVLVGTGVKMGTQDAGGPLAGIIAAVIAILSIVSGRYLSLQFTFNDFFDAEQLAISAVADVDMYERGNYYMPPGDDIESLKDLYPDTVWNDANRKWGLMSEQEQEDIKKSGRLAFPDYAISYIADGICMEKIDKGEDLDWPPESDFDTAWYQDDYPKDVWTEAAGRWENMSPQEQTDYQSSVRETLIMEDEAGYEEFITQSLNEGFVESLEPIDLLFAVLAIAGAFQIANGKSE